MTGRHLVVIVSSVQLYERMSLKRIRKSGSVFSGRPGDLPFEQISNPRLTINLKTAKVLGINIPQTVLLRADEVIR